MLYIILLLAGILKQILLLVDILFIPMKETGLGGMMMNVVMKLSLQDTPG